jgi:hypothetical protein
LTALLRRAALFSEKFGTQLQDTDAIPQREPFA